MRRGFLLPSAASAADMSTPGAHDPMVDSPVSDESAAGSKVTGPF